MSYTPQPRQQGYMTSDWGSSKTKETALKIDHIADKAEFAIEMLESALRGFDTLEKEIVDMSNSTTMPSREQVRAIAYRIDTHQNQVSDGLNRLKYMMKDVDKATDNIQGVRTSW